jgi:hypothetical protein
MQLYQRAALPREPRNAAGAQAMHLQFKGRASFQRNARICNQLRREYSLDVSF